MARARGFSRLSISLAVVALGVVGLDGPVGASVVAAPGTGVGTSLPLGWELCVLEGVGAPATQDNVADLDEWQVAEGGSTNNSSAYNPYNTRQMTDGNNNALPATISSDGFPAFTTWVAGCAATVATLLQPDMAEIVTALKAGTVSPPGAFLVDVDKTQWCAPTPVANSTPTPCYSSEISGGGETLTNAQLTGSTGPVTDGFTIYSDVGAALVAYNQDVAATTAAQNLLTAQTQQLQVADNAVSIANWELAAAARTLRLLALYDYTHSEPLSSDAADLHLFGPTSASDDYAQYYGQIAVSAIIEREHRAQEAVTTAINHKLAVAASVAQAASALNLAEATENDGLDQLSADNTTIQAAGACTGSTPATPAGTPPGTVPTPPGTPVSTVPTPPQAPVSTPTSSDQSWIDTLQTCLAAFAS